MAKREFIDKKSIMNTLTSIDYDTDYECDEFGGNRVYFRTCDYDEVLEKVEYTDTIPEEEIVKPYLEKLKSKIRDRNTLNFTNWQCDIISDKTYKQNFRMYEEMLSIVNTLIDDLLTEKGAD